MSRRQQEHGFTLIELMVVISLLLAILGMGGDFIYTAIMQQNASLTRDTNSQNARNSIDDLVHLLRGANSGDPSIDPITNLASTSFTMYTPDRQAPYHMQKIAYQLSGTNLQRSVTTSTNAAVTWTFPTASPYINVIPNVTSLAFTYKDVNGATTSFSSKVQRVDIAMTIDNDPAHSPLVQTYNLSVDLRITNA